MLAPQITAAPQKLAKMISIAVIAQRILSCTVASRRVNQDVHCTPDIRDTFGVTGPSEAATPSRRRMLKLRNPFTCALAGLAAVLIFSSVAKAQAQQGTHKGSVWKYDGSSRALGSGGPAPLHDLSGSWAGPRSGAGVAGSQPGAGRPPAAWGGELL